MSPVATAIEVIAQRRLLDALALPVEAGVGFVTGATMANFSALAAARHAPLLRAGWDVEAQGLFSAAAVTQQVIAALQADGACWCGGTVWQGQTAMRISVSHGRRPRMMSSAVWRRSCAAPRRFER